MQNKITLPTLAAMLAARSGLSKRVCEDFVRNLFETVSESLNNGESVKIKNIGTFKVSEVEERKSVDVSSGREISIPAHRKVVFLPAKELAAAINSPFEAFEAVEIPDGLTDNDVLSAVSSEIVETLPEVEPVNDIEVNPEAETVNEYNDIIPDEESITEDPASSDSEYELPENEPEPETENIPLPIPEIEQEPEIEPEIDPGIESEPKSVADTEPVKDSQSKMTSQEVASQVKLNPDRRLHFGWGFIVGFACCLVAFAIGATIYFFYRIDNQTTPVAMEIPEITIDNIEVGGSPAPMDSLAPDNTSNKTAEETSSDSQKIESAAPSTKVSKDVDTAPSDAVVRDTISRTRYLTTMAKEHYGNYNLWPYIYEENKAILGHPDRIRPGTSVVVPPLSKYGVSPKNKADIEKARKMGVEIYKRFN